jgi:hypothetical protein
MANWMQIANGQHYSKLQLILNTLHGYEIHLLKRLYRAINISKTKAFD